MAHPDEPVVLRWWGEALCWLGALLLFPVFWSLFLLILIVRLLAYLLTGTQVANVMGIEAIFALGTLQPNGMVSVVMFGDKVPDVVTLWDRFRRLVLEAKQDGRKLFPKFSCYLQFRLGFPVWREIENVQLRREDHIYELPGEVGSEEELEAVINERLNRPLPYGRPEFETIVIRLKSDWRTPYYPGEIVPVFCCIARVNHIYADGVTMVRIMCEIYASNNDHMMKAIRERLGNIKQMRREAMGRLAVSSALIFLTGILLLPYYVIRLLVTRDRGLLRSTQVRTGRKHFCWSHPVPLTRMKAIKLATTSEVGVNITVNDVVMSCVAGALRRFLSERQEYVPATIKTFMPVNIQSLNRPVSSGNKLVLLLVEMATGVSDPVERVLACKRLTDKMKLSLVDWMMNDLLTRMAGLMTRSLLGQIFNLVGAGMGFSNVPGPTVPIDVLGSHIKEAFALVPNLCHMGLTVAFQSYCDNIVVSVVMDKGFGDDIETARAFSRYVLEELDVLEDRLSHHKTTSTELPLSPIVVIQS